MRERRRFLGGAVYAGGKKVGDVIDVQWHQGNYEEEQGMNEKAIIEAPLNPYRQNRLDGAEVELGYASIGQAPPFRHDTDRGPGLTAVDLNRIAIEHFRMGHSTAEREAEAKLEEMQATLGDAFDQGYTAGIAERAQGVAGDFRSRLMDLHFRLVGVERGPKSKRDALLLDVRQTVDELMALAERIRDDDAAALKVEAGGRVGR